MKHFIEEMVTIVETVFILFLITSILTVGMQILTARRIHAGVIEQYQTSYYTADIDEINTNIQKQFPAWEVTVTEFNTVNTRKDAEVTLRYNIVFPVFGTVKEATITGYVR